MGYVIFKLSLLYARVPISTNGTLDEACAIAHENTFGYSTRNKTPSISCNSFQIYLNIGIVQRAMHTRHLRGTYQLCSISGTHVRVDESN